MTFFKNYICFFIKDEIMLDAKENLEDYSSCDITTTTSVDKNHDTFDESAILGEIFFFIKSFVK